MQGSWDAAPSPGLRSSLCSSLRSGCGAPRPLAHELSGFVADAPCRTVRPTEFQEARSGVKSSGQECPLHTSRGGPAALGWTAETAVPTLAVQTLREHVAYAFDLGAYGFQFFFDLLIAPVDVVDAIDDGFAVGY